MAELLAPPIYNRRFSLFRKQDLDAPRVYPIARLQLPRRSIYHFVTTDGVTVGPQLTDQILRLVPGIVYIENVMQLKEPIGSPQKRSGVSPEGLLTEYRRRNRGLRPLRNLERLESDDRSLVVFNYSPIAHLVKYAVSFRAGWFMWRNIYADVYDNVNRLAEISNRQQFIEVDLPAVIPGLDTLRMYRDGASTETFKRLRTSEDMTLADIFQWAGKQRRSSLLGRIKPKHYSKVNLLVRRLNGFVVINLGWLDSFRVNLEVDRKKGFSEQLFELRLLKMLSTIHQATSPIVTETGEETLAEPLVEESVHDEKIDELEYDKMDDEVPEGEEVLVDEDQVVKQLESELEELDKIKELHSGNEIVDEDGNIVDEKIIDVNILSHAAAPSGDGAMVDKANELAAQGLLTGAEHRRLIKVADVSKHLSDPYGTGQTFAEVTNIPDEEIKVEPDVLSDDKVVTDPSLALSRVDAFERGYIKDILKKDIMRCVAGIQKSAVSITSYRIERHTDAVNDQEFHIVKLVPAVGIPSTVRIPVPVVKEDGTFLYNGTNYRMRKQRSDLPIRKVSPTRVALSSYYAKLFVDRSPRVRFDYGKWFTEMLEGRCLDLEDPLISKAVVTAVPDYKYNAPLTFTLASSVVTAFTVGDYDFWFDHKRIREKFEFSEGELAYEKRGWVLCGHGKSGALVMEPSGMIHELRDVDGKWELHDIGTLEQLLDVDISAAPISMAEVNIYSRTLPIGFCLAYLIGLDNLLADLGVKPRRVPVGERLNLAEDEYAVRFKNESLIFDRSNVMVALVMNGFNLYREVIRGYDVGLFNAKDVYAAVLERSKVGSRYLRELDSMNTLFIDPITQDLLEWMKEPVTFTGLLIRSVEMLVNAYVPSRRVDPDRQVESLERIRGYERIAGAVYETLSRAVRTYNARASSGRASIQLNPNEALNNLIKDPTTSPVNNINPIHALREREVLTYGGRGGRSRRAMVASARLFTEEDLGLISEGTVDSGDVAIIAYLSPNSNITSKRGTIRVYDPKRDGPSSLMSTAALLSPCADGDDPKRINFITVQHGHGIKAVGYETQSIRTGMERTIVSRMTPEFASTASGPGKVIEVSDTHIAVEYADHIDRFPLGLVHTNAEGTLYPNELSTSLEVGDEVKKFDVVTYNTGFFKPSVFDKRRVDYMNGCVGRIALREAVYTIEDSASISEAFARRMVTEVSKLKSIRVDFRQNVSGLLKVGDTVDLDTILCTIEDAVSSDAGLYDELTRQTLRDWSAMTPRAKAVGRVAKVEVFYNGDLDEMSDSLAQITAESERNRRRSSKRLGVEYTSGRVGRQVRIDGYNLEEDQAVIQVYITTRGAMGIGDKLVIGNQGKSTVGEILFGDNRTLEGERIDLIFGCKSFIDRIITSPFVIGTTNTLMRFIGEEAYKMYFDSDE